MEEHGKMEMKLQRKRKALRKKPKVKDGSPMSRSILQGIGGLMARARTKTIYEGGPKLFDKRA